MTPHRYDAVARLVDGRQPACGSTKVIAVDGRSGAGKTTVAAHLARATGARVLHLDDVYPGWHGLAATPPIVAAALAELAVDRPARVDRWSWVRDEPAPPRTIEPTPLLVVEGVGSGAAAVRPFLSFLVWVEAPTGVRRERALARDGATYAPFWEVWAAQEARHFAADPTRPHADLVISTA